MSKLLFIPFSVVGGLVAGAISKKAFEALWGLFDDQEAPDPHHREVEKKKLVAALVLEGAIFRAARGLSDHGTRHAFQKLTGTWPGEEQPEAA
jgi:hypothetical protein